MRWRSVGAWRPTTVTLAVAMAFAPAGPLMAADFETVAVGDSRTAAYGCVNNPPICEFDKGGSFGNRGGWPARLQSNDPGFGLGTDYKVENKGVPGESTAEALSRLNGVLAGGYHVLLLSEGINDLVFDGVSAETVKANLKAMDQKAVPFGTDTVFAAIIRKNKDKNYAPVTALKDKVIALAAERKRYVVVDTWTLLCANDPCFNLNYFFTDASFDKAGHPNHLGYDIMAKEWHDVINSKPAPTAAPSLIDPIGDSGEASPVFEWSETTNANYYQLEVTGPGGGIVESAWHRGSDHCGGGTCEVVADGPYGHGIHSWRVRSRNPRGLGPWSAAVDVDVYPTSPVAPLGIGPVGEFCGGLDEDFNWNAVFRASDYRLVIADAQGAEVHNQVYDATTLCGAVFCWLPDPVGLGGGSYSWQVFGQNPHGEGAGGAALFFDVITAVPVEPVQTAPNWETFNRKPPFVWDDSVGVEEYQVQIDGANQGFVSAESVCGAGVCTFIPAADLSIEPHDWKIQARNCLGTGAFSDALAFEVLDCDPEEVVLPKESGVNGSRTEAGCLRLATSPGNPGYRVVSGEVIFHTSVDGVIELFDEFVIESGASFLAVVDK